MSSLSGVAQMSTPQKTLLEFLVHSDIAQHPSFLLLGTYHYGESPQLFACFIGRLSPLEYKSHQSRDLIPPVMWIE